MKPASSVPKLLMLAAGLLLSVRVFLFAPFMVEQSSMAPTLVPGAYVLGDSLLGRVLGYQAGDIVVFADPAGHDLLIKRVVVVGPARVTIASGAVWRNGIRLDETYLPTGTVTAARGVSEFTLSADQLFVLGDNRAHSLDSRLFGPIAASSVESRLVVVFSR